MKWLILLYFEQELKSNPSCVHSVKQEVWGKHVAKTDFFLQDNLRIPQSIHHTTDEDAMRFKLDTDDEISKKGV